MLERNKKEHFKKQIKGEKKQTRSGEGCKQSKIARRDKTIPVTKYAEKKSDG